MKMESTLSILNLDGNQVPMLAFNFVDPDGAQCVVDFEPKRVLLAESKDEGYFDMVDDEGFKYARVKRSPQWEDAALAQGLFVLSMRTPLAQEGRVGGRIMMVSFPFGSVIRDSGTFSANVKDIDKLETVEAVTHKLRDSASRAFKALREKPGQPN